MATKKEKPAARKHRLCDQRSTVATACRIIIANLFSKKVDQKHPTNGQDCKPS
jgi:hypothetical protein